MSSNTLDKVSFSALFLVIVLLPIFFIPFVKIPVENAKGLLLVVGLIVSFIFWLAARLAERKIVFPKSALLFSGLGVVLVFFLSSILSPVSQVSLFGTMFDVGSFWFIFSCFLLMFMCSVILQDSKKVKMVLGGTIISFTLLFILQSLRFFIPNVVSLGVLSATTDNLFGSWNALGLFSGFIGIISLFVIEFFSISKVTKLLLAILILISLVFVAIVNFPLAWVLLGVFALIIFIYKTSFHSGFQEGGNENIKFPSASLAVVIVSLLFFVSGQFIISYLPAKLQVVNVEANPNFGATMSVTKSVLMKHPVLGLGPNKFGEAWALYKGAEINAAQFWNTNFEVGSGLLPTLASTTGLLGILSLLIFFLFLGLAGLRSIFVFGENQANFETTVFFLAALYLFISSFFYSVGIVIFSFAFIYTGIFIGLTSHRQGREVSISFLDNPKKSFFLTSIVVVMIIVSAGFGFKYIERFVSIPYFMKALVSDTAPQAEASIRKALNLNENSLYLRTYAQIYLIKFNSLANKGSALSDSEKADLQSSLNEAIGGAQLAVSSDKLNYLNFQSLGSVYGTAGLLGVSDVYGKAIEAYTAASSLNPLNPELKLSIARVYLADKKTVQAKDFVNQALALKPDYIDGVIVLSQIAKSEGDNNAALFYAKRAFALAPDSQDLKNYVDSLQNSTTAPTPQDNSKETKKKGI